MADTNKAATTARRIAEEKCILFEMMSDKTEEDSRRTACFICCFMADT
jgi:hypothetical protein